MPSAIITGATGYIGSHVAKHLLLKGWRISAICRKESSLKNLENLIDRIEILQFNGEIELLIDHFRQFNPDIVLHIAAAVNTNPHSNQISNLIRSNIEFGTLILEAMRQSDCRLIVNTGTNWQNYNSNAYNPVDLYSATKEAFENILKHYVNTFDLRAITLRLYDVYGEDDIRPKLWNTLRKIAGTNATLNLTLGEQLISLVHIDDVVNAYEIAADTLLRNEEIKNEIFGIPAKELRPLKEIVNLFESVIGKPINLNWGGKPYKSNEVMAPYTGYKTLPGWKPEISLINGFKRFK